MTPSKRSKLAIAGVVLVSAAALIGVKHNRCELRNAMFGRQVQALKRDAYDQLRIGTKHAEVVRFFAEHHIAVTFAYSLASGTIQTTGCSPFGCGADSATIGVSVEVDQQGTVIGKPLVSGIYNDCL